MDQINRRGFLQTTLGTAAASSLLAQSSYEWGGPVLDIHLHLSRPGVNFAHIEGSGVTIANLLTPVLQDERAKAEIAKHPGRFMRSVSADATQPETLDLLRTALKNDARGMGEMKQHVAVDGPEMRRIYDLSAEINVPVTMHFQEVRQSASDANFTFNEGLRRLPAVLKANPKATIVGHADFFWANVSADVPTDVGYPTTPIRPGGLSDRMLSDYPNLYGDLSANSGRNALARDPEFMRGFLARHQDKLMFGSDCPCTDGHGAGQVSQQPLIKGKCVARETLTALQAMSSPEVFRKITWTNAVKLYKVKVSPA